MIKILAIAAVLCGLAATSVMAQAVPPPVAPATPAPAATSTLETADACLKAAADLAQTAEEKRLAEDKLDKIDDLLTRMETHCDARQFAEATAVAQNIKSIIEQ